MEVQGSYSEQDAIIIWVSNNHIQKFQSPIVERSAHSSNYCRLNSHSKTDLTMLPKKNGKSPSKRTGGISPLPWWRNRRRNSVTEEEADREPGESSGEDSPLVRPATRIPAGDGLRRSSGLEQATREGVANDDQRSLRSRHRMEDEIQPAPRSYGGFWRGATRPVNSLPAQPREDIRYSSSTAEFGPPGFSSHPSRESESFLMPPLLPPRPSVPLPPLPGRQYAVANRPASFDGISIQNSQDFAVVHEESARAPRPPTSDPRQMTLRQDQEGPGSERVTHANITRANTGDGGQQAQQGSSGPQTPTRPGFLRRFSPASLPRIPLPPLSPKFGGRRLSFPSFAGVLRRDRQQPSYTVIRPPPTIREHESEISLRAALSQPPAGPQNGTFGREVFEDESSADSSSVYYEESERESLPDVVPMPNDEILMNMARYNARLVRSDGALPRNHGGIANDRKHRKIQSLENMPKRHL